MVILSTHTEVVEKKTLLLVAFFLIFQVVIAQPVIANGKPTRVISINLCTDQLVLQLLDRDRIASVTYLAADPTISYSASRAVGLVKNHGLAEEVVALNPDLILAGAFTSRPTTSLLKKLGYRVIEFEMAGSFETLRQNIIKAGEVLDEEKKAGRLVTQFDRALGNLASSGRLVSAIILQPNAAGAGNVSLLDDIFRSANLTSISLGQGILGIGWLTLDQVIWAQPELIISDMEPRWPSLGHLAMRHPAYRAIRDKQGRVPNRVNLPANLWNCGGPQIAKAVSILAKARAAALNLREIK
jgi:iron complex transport system substrate-binding protein